MIRKRRAPAAPSRPVRVAIIGAGPGGLAAALLLRRAGLEVSVFEKQAQVGGRTRTVTTPDGYHFDLGPTFFLYPRVLQEIFAACGEDLDRHIELRRLDPLYRIVFEEGNALDVAADPERLAAEIARIAPDDARELRGFLAENRAKLHAFRPVLERSFDRLRDLVAPEMLRALPKLRPFTSVDRDLRRHFADPRVRLAFSFQTKYIGMSPFRCPSLFTILSFLEHEHGIFHPIGGCGSVSKAMGRLAQRMGAAFHLGTAVDRIEYRDGRPAMVEAAGQRHAVDAVVLGADFAQASRSLIPEQHRPLWRNRRLDRARLSCSTFMLYLGIEGEIPHLAHHTILLSEGYKQNLREIETGVLPQQPSLYVQHAAATEPAMAPKGHSSLYVLVPVPNLRATIDWKTAAPAYRRLVLDRLALLGLPDLERRIRFERVVTPDDWRQDFAIDQGATFNLAHDFRQMLWFRPHNRFGPGIYLVGGGTHPGSGLPVIFEGARISSRLLLEDFGVDPGFIGARSSLADATEELGVAA